MFGKSPEKTCPMLKKPCIGQQCKMFIPIKGTHPQTGDPVENWDCVFVWQPILTIEDIKELRGAVAAIESLRNIVAGSAPAQLLE